ncbi:MAG: MATE family efflux transporter [Lachnospiraceae bacterium]|nr:MATE family efflux transporter [Lachnospiraceae bacterium]
MDQSFMKKEKVLPLVVKMSYPMAISMAVNALYNIIDSFYVAKFSGQAMTAISLFFPVQNLAHAILVGFAIGINAVVSFFLGAKEERAANHAAASGVVLNFIHGITLMVLCTLITYPFLNLFTKDETVITYALSYARIIFVFQILDSIAISFEKIFQAVGRMKTSMFSMAAGCIVNILLDPILIFGLGPIPAMGIEGAAIATGIGQTCALIIYLAVYFWKPMPVKIHLKGFRFEKSLCARLYSIGSAASLNIALPSVQVTVLNVLLSGYGEGYILVLGVYYKLQTFLYLSANGVVQGIRPLVGYNYGAGEMKRVKKIYQISMKLIAIIMVIGTVLCLAIPAKLIGLFSEEEQVIQIGANALRIISAGFVVSTLSVVSCGTLEGLGKGKESLLISLARYIVLILPLAFVLNEMFGAAGIWHAFWITEAIAAVISVYSIRKIEKC